MLYLVVLESCFWIVYYWDWLLMFGYKDCLVLFLCKEIFLWLVINLFVLGCLWFCCLMRILNVLFVVKVIFLVILFVLELGILNWFLILVVMVVM